MKNIFLVFLFSITCNCFAIDPPAHIQVRKSFYKASEDKAAVKDLLSQLGHMKPSDPMCIGYRGMAKMLKAKYAWNPYNKLHYFNDGRNLLEEAVVMDPDNVELRFLRLSVQLNAPGFLNYDNNHEEDIELILEEWDGLEDEDLKARVREFLAGADIESPEIAEVIMQL